MVRLSLHTTLNELLVQRSLRYEIPSRRGTERLKLGSQACGGSSAGSAVGVSAGFSPMSLGTQTGGSLIYPASKAGLYAMLPTLTTVAVDGSFRISRSFDGIGGIAKSVVDLAALTETILLPQAKENLLGGGYKSVMSGSWDGMKIGVVESTWGGGNPEKWASGLVVGSSVTASQRATFH